MTKYARSRFRQTQMPNMQRIECTGKYGFWFRFWTDNSSVIPDTKSRLRIY